MALALCTICCLVSFIDFGFPVDPDVFTEISSVKSSHFSINLATLTSCSLPSSSKLSVKFNTSSAEEKSRPFNLNAGCNVSEVGVKIATEFLWFLSVLVVA